MDPDQNGNPAVPTDDQPMEGMTPEAPVVPGEETPVEEAPAPEVGETTPEEPQQM